MDRMPNYRAFPLDTRGHVVAPPRIIEAETAARDQVIGSERMAPRRVRHPLLQLISCEETSLKPSGS